MPQNMKNKQSMRSFKKNNVWLETSSDELYPAKCWSMATNILMTNISNIKIYCPKTNKN